jgi:hypothetical protein
MGGMGVTMTLGGTDNSSPFSHTALIIIEVDGGLIFPRIGEMQRTCEGMETYWYLAPPSRRDHGSQLLYPLTLPSPSPLIDPVPSDSYEQP